MFPNKQLGLAALAAVLLCGPVRAENPPAPVAVPVILAPPAKAPEPSVFDLEPKAAPRTSKGSAQGVERYYGDEPDYNTEQRAQWLAKCGPKKEVDYNAYRECYENEKRKTQQQLRLQRERASTRSGDRFRDAAPAIDGPGGD